MADGKDPGLLEIKGLMSTAVVVPDALQAPFSYRTWSNFSKRGARTPINVFPIWLRCFRLLNSLPYRHLDPLVMSTLYNV